MCSTRRAMPAVPSFSSFPVLVLLLLQMAGPSNGFRLTSMNTPVIADLREEMELDCHFDMGLEELYAVKWYKDDHEFFRYMPKPKPNIMSFPVAGVNLVKEQCNCKTTYCKIRLRDLSREQSGGAYRCEISSEAPAFRLTSETHNITIAALPKSDPRIESLTPPSNPAEGDTLEAKCVSDFSDPAPILSWYVNGQPVPVNSVGTTTSSTNSLEIDSLYSVTQFLNHPVDRQLAQSNSIEVKCEAALPGIPLKPRVTTRIVGVQNANVQSSQVNNQKWYSSTATSPLLPVVFLLLPIFLRQWTI